MVRYLGSARPNADGLNQLSKMGLVQPTSALKCKGGSRWTGDQVAEGQCTYRQNDAMVKASDGQAALETGGRVGAKPSGAQRPPAMMAVKRG